MDLDLEAEFTKVPDRANLRPVFREWELRDPLRRLEEALVAAEADGDPAPRGGRRRARCPSGRAARPTSAKLKGDELMLVASRPRRRRAS